MSRVSSTNLVWSLIVAGIFFLPAATAPAQQPPQGGGSQSGQSGTAAIPVGDRIVSLDTEGGRLVDVLPDLMKSAGADFAVDGAVKNARATIHIAKAKLNTALDGLMKVCDIPVAYKVESGLYHFMAASAATAGASNSIAEPSAAPRKRGPAYNGGDPIAVAVSELMAFLSGSEPALSGKSPFPDGSSIRAGVGSLSGSRKFSDYGFINGRFSSSSFTTPDISNPLISNSTGGYGYFGPIVIGGSRRR